MDEKRLAEIGARVKKATPGPWEYHENAAGSESSPGLTGPRGPVFTSTAFWSHSDGHLAAHARQDVPDLLAEVQRLTTAKDEAYAERNKLVAWLARAAAAFGWRAGVGQHPATDTTWEADWRTIVFIDTPAGQLSWHFHDSEKPLLWGLPVYLDAWDGHSTTEKYERLARATPSTEP